MTKGIQACYDRIYLKLLDSGEHSVDFREGLSYALAVLAAYRDEDNELPRMGRTIRRLEEEECRQIRKMHLHLEEGEIDRAQYNAGACNALRHAVSVMQKEMLDG